MRSYRSRSTPIKAIACVASPRSANPLPDTIGDTAVMSSRRSSNGTRACQFTSERGRCSRGWVSLITVAPDAAARAGSTTSSGERSVMCAWAPSVLVRVLPCSPLISAEM